MKTKSKPALKARNPRTARRSPCRKIVPFQASEPAAESPAPAEAPAATAPTPTTEEVVVETLRLPIPILQAAAAIAATADESRHILRHVYIHATDPGHVHVAGTNGKQFFVGRVVVGDKIPSWAAPGLLLSVEALEARLKFLTTGGTDVTLSHIAETSASLLISEDETITLRQPIGSGPFPAYDQLVTAASFSEEEIAPEFSACPMTTDQLKVISKLGALLQGPDKRKQSCVRQFRGGLKSNVVIDFPDTPGAMLIVAPISDADVLPEATAALVAPAISATVTALKAHMTRAKKAGEKVKAEAYAARIKAILDRTSKPALPAPAPAEGSTSETADTVAAE